MIEELEREFVGLRQRTDELGVFFDAPARRRELEASNPEIARPDFWQNPEAAQQLLAKRKRLEETIEKDERLAQHLSDIDAYFELAREGEKVEPELETEISRLSEDLDRMETASLLSGENDRLNAIVTLHPGAGGTESQDWAEMLLRMYRRWCERRGFKFTLMDFQAGEEAGLKSATFTAAGEYAYGLLASEIGVHRLVRISPFDSAARRHTSFASVFVSPEIDESITIDIRPDELRVETYRSTGAGGQHVNTTDSAVRVIHIATGTVAQCQNERSQHRNRDMAMKMLRSKLYELELEKKRAETEKLEASKADIDFGSQVRSYVLHPYRLIKDHRTKLEIGDTDRVLDGDIDPFIKAYLLWRRPATAVLKT
ncbi:MAG TPA: peptide chain release factor 2 [Terriglobia bacterium]|nr:peptide chain release factor 2 [Terriglobia bacterium]